MSTSEEQLLATIKNLKKNDKDKHLEKVKLSSIISFNNNLEKSFQKSLEAVKKQDLFNSLSFYMWNEIWNDYGIYGAKKEHKRNKFAGKNFSRGRLIFIDYGQHNIGREFSYEHIGVVLQDFGNLITVLPVTSDRGQTFDSRIEKSIIRVKSKDYNQFDNDSILLLHQIRSIDKNRIVKDLFKAIARTPLMEKIEENLVLTYSPYLNKKSEDTITALNTQIGEQNLRIDELEKILEANGITVNKK